MKTIIQEPTFEIVPADSGLAPEAAQSLAEAFSGFFKQAEAIKKETDGITEPKAARAARLKIKNLRVEAEKKRKALKEESLRMGKAIDGSNHILLALIVPIEERMEEIEKAAERAEAARIAALREERETALKPYGVNTQFYRLEDMPEDEFQALLNQSRLAHEARLEEARKAEETRLKAIEEEKARQEAIRVENERLKQEAEAREAAAAAEREKAAKEKAALEAAQAAELARIAKERAAAEAKAKKEREAAEAAAATEKAAREKAEAELRAKEEAEKARIEAERQAEAKRLADEEKARLEAEKAPDRDKLMAFAEVVDNLEVPMLKTQGGRMLSKDLLSKLDELSAWIRREAENL